MDSYQPIYDAVRSRIHNGDIGAAVQDALRNADIGHLVHSAMCSIQEAAGEHARPSAVYRPELTRDGNMYCALYGPNLHEGVAGFGETPDQAMRDFDANWHKALQPPTKGGCQGV